jgi:hypothetical protein
MWLLPHLKKPFRDKYDDSTSLTIPKQFAKKLAETP